MQRVLPHLARAWPGPCSSSASKWAVWMIAVMDCRCRSLEPLARAEPEDQEFRAAVSEHRCGPQAGGSAATSVPAERPRTHRPRSSAPTTTTSTLLPKDINASGSFTDIWRRSAWQETTFRRQVNCQSFANPRIRKGSEEPRRTRITQETGSSMTRPNRSSQANAGRAGTQCS